MSKRSDLVRRRHYYNRPPLAAQLEATRGKFDKKEAKSFHVALPRFVALNRRPYYLTIILGGTKGKGRIIVDSSSKLASDDTEALTIKSPNRAFRAGETKTRQISMVQHCRGNTAAH